MITASHIVALLAFGCAGERPEDSSPPVPVPPEADDDLAPFTVTIVDRSGEPVSGVQVALNDGDGELRTLVTTNDDGIVSAMVGEGPIATVLDGARTTSVFDLPDDGVLVVPGPPVSGPAPEGFPVRLAEPFPGASDYRASTGGCGGTLLGALGPDSPANLGLASACLSPEGGLDVLGWAFGPDGERLAASALLDVSPPLPGDALVLPAFASDLETVVLALDAPRVGNPGVVALELDARRAGGRFRAFDDISGETTVPVAPPGFADGLEVVTWLAVDETTVVQVRRLDEVPDVVTPLASLETSLVSRWDGQQLDVLVDGPLPDDAVARGGLIQRGVGPLDTVIWVVAGAPDRTTFRFPQIPIETAVGEVAAFEGVLLAGDDVTTAELLREFPLASGGLASAGHLTSERSERSVWRQTVALP